MRVLFSIITCALLACCAIHSPQAGPVGFRLPVATFSPASISGLQLWLDASQIAGLNDGDAVATWSDLSGNGNDVTQGTASQRPTYKVNIFGTKPALLFDGVDDFLRMTNTFGFSAGTLFAVYKPTAGSYQVVCVNVDSAQKYWRFVNDGNGYWGIFTAEAVRLGGYPAAMPGSGTPAYVVDVSTAAQKEVYVNGISKGATASTFESPTLFNVGGTENVGAPRMTGYIAEVGMYNSAISAGNLALLQAYIATKYGL